MKNSIRRLISLATVLALLILSAAVLSGCYVVKSGKMYKIEGTYQLTSYSGKSDYIAERGMTLYIVIRSDGTGYYAYSMVNFSFLNSVLVLVFCWVRGFAAWGRTRRLNLWQRGYHVSCYPVQLTMSLYGLSVYLVKENVA